MWGQNPIAAGPQMPTNPLIEMMRRMQQGVNPQQIVGTLAKQNPQMQSFYQLIDGKNAEQLQATAQNIAQQKGIDLNQLQSQLQSMMGNLR